jgi:hypothetical protein
MVVSGSELYIPPRPALLPASPGEITSAVEPFDPGVVAAVDVDVGAVVVGETTSTTPPLLWLLVSGVAGAVGVELAIASASMSATAWLAASSSKSLVLLLVGTPSGVVRVNDVVGTGVA